MQATIITMNAAEPKTYFRGTPALPDAEPSSSMAP